MHDPRLRLLLARARKGGRERGVEGAAEPVRGAGQGEHHDVPALEPDAGEFPLLCCVVGADRRERWSGVHDVESAQRTLTSRQVGAPMLRPSTTPEPAGTGSRVCVDFMCLCVGAVMTRMRARIEWLYINAPGKP